VPVAASFSEKASMVLVAGSTWPPDEDMLARYINQAPDEVRLIVAPHEVHEAHILQLEQKLKVPAFRLSQKDKVDTALYKVMIIDTIGLLSAIYRYGHVAYVGGGFGKGIHNTLEAVTYAMPVLFGPRYRKFKEASDLINCGGGFSVGEYKGFLALMEKFREDEESLDASGTASGEYVRSMCGATRNIMDEVFL
jgi:3-deoxy-D-manno-octulosonic-acid transferase